MPWMDEEWVEANIERVRNLSDEEVKASLRRAGIIDEEGNLTERYRPPEGWDQARHPDLGIVDKLRAMPREQVIATLREAGIVDTNGRLAERYRPSPDRAKERAG